MTIDRRRCAIVIPFHHTNFKDYEIQSLNQGVRVFLNRDIYIICPQSLSLDNIDDFIVKHNIMIRRFPDHWFTTSASYNRLCLDKSFYQEFSDYEFMLIYQLDAYVFEDKIDKFCKMGFDYIGSPWCHKCKHRCNTTIKYDNNSLIGNGGLSLRNISKFIDITSKIDNSYISEDNDNQENEDMVFSSFNDIKRPDCETAIRFSVESFASFHILHNGITPMGYHNMKTLEPQMIPIVQYTINNRISRDDILS